MLKFSIKVHSEPVIICDENGNELTYSICQLTGAQADDYRASQAAKVEIDGKGEVVKFNDFTGQYTDLLTRCLKSPDGKLVPKATLETWPDDVLKELHAEALRINKMNVDEEDEIDPKKS
jgi:hypothetical protein